jgi:uncharacterized protein YqeY
MSLYKKIIDDAKEAMVKKEELRLNVLKGLKAAFMNEMLAKKTSTPELGDEETLNVVRRAVKQRRDSIEQFGKGGRKDLVDSEMAELKILEAYLPAMMSEADIKKVAEKKKAELGFSDKTKAGMLMSAIMKDLKGKADGTDVKRIVEEILN